MMALVVNGTQTPNVRSQLKLCSLFGPAVLSYGLLCVRFRMSKSVLLYPPMQSKSDVCALQTLSQDLHCKV